MEKETIVASDDKVVCGACGSDEVEVAVWRTLNGDEYVDHVSDLCHYCPMCEDGCETMLKSQYDDYILRKWKDVARSASASRKVEITQELAHKLEQESLIDTEASDETILKYVINGYIEKETPRRLTNEEMELCTDAAWETVARKQNNGALVRDEVMEHARELYERAVFNRTYRGAIRSQMRTCMSAAVAEFVKRSAGLVPHTTLGKKFKTLGERHREYKESPRTETLEFRVLKERDGYGLHPSDVNWESLAATRSRGFPVGERAKVPDELTSDVTTDPSECGWGFRRCTKSDVVGINEKLRNSFTVPYSYFWGSPNIQVAPPKMFPMVEQLTTDVSPCSLTSWIQKPISTIGDK